jgi:putative transposase
MCRVLGVSASGYYAWRGRPASERARSNAELVRKIRTIHVASRGTYGVPRVHAELRAEGIRVGRKRIARLMQAAEIRGVSRRRFVGTTVRGEEARSAPDLVQRAFRAEGPDRLWVADITYIPTWAGFLYLAIVLDAWSRKVVGFAMATHLRTELVLEALEMALFQRRPSDVVHHSDQGCQYTSIAFGKRCLEAGVRPSMGSVGDAYDNAMAESFFATLECELLARRPLRTQAEGVRTVFEFIEGWYNPHRRHSSIGYLSPNEFEKRHAEGVALDGPDPRSSLLGDPGEPSSSGSARNLKNEGNGGSAPEPRLHTSTGGDRKVLAPKALTCPPNRGNSTLSTWIVIEGDFSLTGGSRMGS